jgi:hypothetical protein
VLAAPATALPLARNLLPQSPIGYNEPGMKAQSAKPSRPSKQENAGRTSRKREQGATQKNPRPLTEDEADILYGEKHKDEKGIPWDQVKAKLDAMDR